MLSCMGKRVARCVCGPRQAWGKAGLTGDIISRKNNKIRNHPPPALRPLSSHPSSGQLSMNSSLYLTLFPPRDFPSSVHPSLHCYAASPLFSLTNQFSSEHTPCSFLHHHSHYYLYLSGVFSNRWFPAYATHFSM